MRRLPGSSPECLATAFSHLIQFGPNYTGHANDVQEAGILPGARGWESLIGEALCMKLSSMRGTDLLVWLA